MAQQSGSNVPQIRFQGFKGEWEKKTLGEIVLFLDELRKPLKAGSRKPGRYPYYGASGIIDYVEDYLFSERLILLSEDGANIIDRHYPICFIADGKYWVNNHAHVLRASPGFSEIFIRDSLERLNFEQYNTGTAQPKLNQEVCRNIPLQITETAEQTKIGKYFREMDSLIGLHQRKHDKLETLKKAMLQKMFPQPGTTTPEIRFKGFEGDWMEIPIGDILSETKRSIVLEDNQQYELVTVKRRNGGVVSRGWLWGRDILVKNYSLLETDDFLISKRQVVHGATGIVPAALNGAIVSNEYLVAVSNSRISTNYFAILSSLPEMRQKFFLSSYGVDIEKLFFDAEDWKKRVITIPKLPEQNQIDTYFRTLDALISKHATQLQKLQQIKSACLEKMFV